MREPLERHGPPQLAESGGTTQGHTGARPQLGSGRTGRRPDVGRTRRRCRQGRAARRRPLPRPAGISRVESQPAIGGAGPQGRGGPGARFSGCATAPMWWSRRSAPAPWIAWACPTPSCRSVLRGWCSVPCRPIRPGTASPIGPVGTARCRPSPACRTNNRAGAPGRCSCTSPPRAWRRASCWPPVSCRRSSVVRPTVRASTCRRRCTKGCWPTPRRSGRSTKSARRLSPHHGQDLSARCPPAVPLRVRRR